MLTIYGLPLSGFCGKVRVVLRHKHLNWQQLPPPGGYKSDEYKKIVPSGNLPTLIDDDLMLADSEVINEYLNEKYPEPAMLPDAPIARAKVRELSRFHDTRLEPEVRKLYPHIRPENRNPNINQQQSKEISTRLEQLARILDGSSADIIETLNLGTVGYCFTFAWIDALTPVLDLSITWPDKIIDFRQKLELHPSIDTEIQPYRPLLREWFVENNIT